MITQATTGGPGRGEGVHLWDWPPGFLQSREGRRVWQRHKQGALRAMARSLDEAACWLRQRVQRTARVRRLRCRRAAAAHWQRQDVRHLTLRLPQRVCDLNPTVPVPIR